MRGKKTRDEDIEAVKIAKITDPQKSLRDIEKETWVNYVTVSDIIDEIPEDLTGSNKWEKILNTMDEIISEIADITRLAINPIRDKVIEWTLTVGDLKQLNDIAKNNFDRKQILTGKPTDITKHEWLSTLSTEELLKITNW